MKPEDVNYSILDIETKYKVNGITYNRRKIWPIVRMDFEFALKKKVVQRKTVKQTFLKVCNDVLYGFRNWFGRYDYIILSNPRMRTKINEKMFNVSFDIIADKLGQDKVLFIDRPNPFHISIDQIYSKHIVSARLIDILSVLIRKFFLKSIQIKNVNVLEQIKDDYNIDINYNQIIKRFKSDTIIYKILFKIYKPKAIFITSYYSSLSFIAIAKKMGITVIEMQHGMIGKKHPAYHSCFSYKEVLPDILLTYGKNDIKTIKSSNLFNSIKCYPVGNFYLEYIQKHYTPDNEIQYLSKQYKFVVGVSLQWTVSDKLLVFLEDIAMLSTDILFLLIPRKGEFFEYQSNFSNIIVYEKTDCYNVIQNADFHVTVYSTCAVEAPSLGIPNILINIDNLSVHYLEDMCLHSYSRVVNTPEEFLTEAILIKKLRMKKEEIINSNLNNYINGFESNIDKFLSKDIFCKK